jgi:hypothetical protein
MAYIQAFSPSLESGCSVSYPQIMVINKETATTGTDAYGNTDQGNNSIVFTVTPNSIGVQRGNATVTRQFHF